MGPDDLTHVLEVLKLSKPADRPRAILPLAAVLNARHFYLELGIRGVVGLGPPATVLKNTSHFGMDNIWLGEQLQAMPNSAVRLSDGSFDFSFGVDSSRVTTVASNITPQGLPRNALAWLDNATVRGGGITQRNGWLKLFLALAQGSGNYQGGFLYTPTDGTTPYLMLSISGVIWQCLLDGSETVTNLSAAFGVINPADPPQVWMEQAEEFLIIQAGDFFTASTPTLPLFWDGTTLRRSNGLAPPIPGVTQYALTSVFGWVVPAVGTSVTVTLNAEYPGSDGDQITWGNYGTFSVTSFTTGSPFTVTMTTVSTSLAGATVIPGNYSVQAVTVPAASTHTVDITNGWTGPGVSGNVILQLSASYPGTGLGDVVTWPGPGTTNFAFVVIGLLTKTNANDTVLASMTVINQTYTIPPGFTLPTGAGQVWTIQPATTVPPNVSSRVAVTNTTGNLSVGHVLTVHLTAPYGGPGVPGDTLFWFYGAPVYPDALVTTQIVSVTNGGLTINMLVTGLAGRTTFPPGFTFAAGDYDVVEAQQPTPPVTAPTAELPAATCMKYYSGILFYAQGSTYTGGDIVLSASGTIKYGFRDAILKVTENQLAVIGQGFSVPAQAGNITALFYTANLNTALGQGPLYIGTRTAVYQLAVPSTLVDWTNANNANQPVQTVAQFKFGPVGDRCVALVNGDAFYQTLEPAIRSFQVSQRYFGQWANVPISNNENRVLRFNQRALMPTASGIDFDNRLLQTILPFQSPVGVAFQAIAPLDFDLISTLQEQRPPAWEGLLEGLNILQLFEADFGGVQRAFAVAWSDPSKSGDGGMWIWELTSDNQASQRDDEDNRVTWFFETPAWTMSSEFDLKELDWLQLWIDRVAGTVDVTVQYRPDADNCWRFWGETSFCSARSTCEDPINPICYPEQPYCEGQKFPLAFPKPPPPDCQTQNQRPTNIGFQFQLRVTIKGFCRVRGLLVQALPRNQETFQNLQC